MLTNVKSYINIMAIFHTNNPLYICKGYLRHKNLGKNKKHKSSRNYDEAII